MAVPEPIQKLIPLDSPEEWNQALEGIPHSFTHTRDYCYAMHLTTEYPTYLYSLRSGDTRIICPIAERPCGKYVETVTPIGFSGFAGTGDLAEFPSLWEEFARSREYVTAYVTLNPLFDRPSFTNLAMTRQHNSLYFLDLDAAEEKIIQGFSQSRRRGLRKWQESGVQIITEREILTQFFLQHYRGFFRAKGLPPAYDFTESTITLLLSLDQVYVVGASTSSGLQSVLVCCFTPDVAESFLNVSLPCGNEHVAGLTWHAAKHFRSLGIPKFNLGGGVASNEGVAEAKRRFGAYPLPLRSLRLIVRPNIYNDLCAAAGCENENDGYFPPYQQGTGVEGFHV
jgi:hypothetical protein